MLLGDSGRLGVGSGETLGGFGKALGRLSDRPSDRPTDYIFKLPINRTRGTILLILILILLLLLLILILIPIVILRLIPI